MLIANFLDITYFTYIALSWVSDIKHLLDLHLLFFHKRARQPKCLGVFVCMFDAYVRITIENFILVSLKISNEMFWLVLSFCTNY